MTSSGYAQRRGSVGELIGPQQATYQVKHDFAKQHVLERSERTWIVLRAQVLKRLIEVGICGRVVLVLSVQDTRLKVETRLQLWRAIY